MNRLTQTPTYPGATAWKLFCAPFQSATAPAEQHDDEEQPAQGPPRDPEIAVRLAAGGLAAARRSRERRSSTDSSGGASSRRGSFISVSFVRPTLHVLCPVFRGVSGGRCAPFRSICIRFGDFDGDRRRRRPYAWSRHGKPGQGRGGRAAAPRPRQVHPILRSGDARGRYRRPARAPARRRPRDAPHGLGHAVGRRGLRRSGGARRPATSRRRPGRNARAPLRGDGRAAPPLGRDRRARSPGARAPRRADPRRRAGSAGRSSLEAKS